jgi:hypothetical protein
VIVQVPVGVVQVPCRRVAPSVTPLAATRAAPVLNRASQPEDPLARAVTVA